MCFQSLPRSSFWAKKRIFDKENADNNGDNKSWDFPGNPTMPLSYPYDTLISYKKSKKSLEPFSRTSGELICSKQLLATYEC